jgi:hypothetical protein
MTSLRDATEGGEHIDRKAKQQHKSSFIYQLGLKTTRAIKAGNSSML